MHEVPQTKQTNRPHNNLLMRVSSAELQAPPPQQQGCSEIYNVCGLMCVVLSPDPNQVHPAVYQMIQQLHTEKKRDRRQSIIFLVGKSFKSPAGESLGPEPFHALSACLCCSTPKFFGNHNSLMYAVVSTTPVIDVSPAPAVCCETLREAASVETLSKA